MGRIGIGVEGGGGGGLATRSVGLVYFPRRPILISHTHTHTRLGKASTHGRNPSQPRSSPLPFCPSLFPALEVFAPAFPPLLRRVSKQVEGGRGRKEEGRAG